MIAKLSRAITHALRHVPAWLPGRKRKQPGMRYYVEGARVTRDEYNAAEARARDARCYFSGGVVWDGAWKPEDYAPAAGSMIAWGTSCDVSAPTTDDE